MQLPAGFRVVPQATELERAAHALVRAVPAGAVVSYGRVADGIGRTGRARAVGRAMAGCPPDVPWHRVVTATGRLVPGHEREQAQRLRREGVAVVSGRVRPPVPWWEGIRAQVGEPPAHSTRS